MILRAALVMVILLCILAFGQRADGPYFIDPLNEINALTETVTPALPVPSNESHSSMPVLLSIVDAAKAESDLNALVAAIRSAELVELLSSPGPFTVFAPTDKAFAKISEADLEDILRSNQTLASVLTYHIILGNISSADLKNGMQATSKEGGKLTFNISTGGLMVNNANITKANIVACNGIIHVIDTVLGYKALAFQPQTSGDWLDKGIALKDMGKYKESLEAFKKAIEEDPQLTKAWYEQGLILDIFGRKKEAQASYARARM